MELTECMTRTQPSLKEKLEEISRMQTPTHDKLKSTAGTDTLQTHTSQRKPGILWSVYGLFPLFPMNLKNSTQCSYICLRAIAFKKVRGVTGKFSDPSLLHYIVAVHPRCLPSVPFLFYTTPPYILYEVPKISASVWTILTFKPSTHVLTPP